MHFARLGLIAALLAVPLQGCVPLVIGGAAATTAVIHDRRAAGTVLEDQGNELAIRKRLNDDSAFAEGSHINVTSYNNVVLLTGEVPSREVGLKAGEIARTPENVRQVHNELVIAPPSSLTERSSDSLITTAVKSNMFTVDLPKFDPTRVTVVTERGVVYLFGLLTREEAEQVTDRARRVQGVQRVVRLFELQD